MQESTTTRLASLAFAAALLGALSVTAPRALAQGGRQVSPGGKATLNPQPLPPKVRTRKASSRKLHRDPTTGRAIIIVSGKRDWRKTRRPGGAVMLNPQPLPPKALQAR